jgi:hypothetical protein
MIARGVLFALGTLLLLAAWTLRRKLRRMNTTYPSDLSDAEWACAKRYLPA